MKCSSKGAALRKEPHIHVSLWFNPLTTNVTNHIETSHCKSIDWFLYDGQDWLLMVNEPSSSIKCANKDLVVPQTSLIDLHAR